MTLDEEIAITRKEIISDGYDMSIGEVINLYKDNELVINPAFQRLFRWDVTRKTRFIESLLLGIPIPPIFVVQDEDGIWELIDGLQRISTVLEFAGLLKDSNSQLMPPSIVEGTNFLPTLFGKKWEESFDGAGDGIGKSQQLEIKRARLRVEILKKESDPKAKYELFQRLNTGGASLTAQEVRNCVAVMINHNFYSWLVKCSENQDFINTTVQTSTALEQQMGVELALRFFAFRNVPYDSRLDVHEYLDSALEVIATNKDFPIEAEGKTFETTFKWLSDALGSSAFTRWNAENQSFSGKFLMSSFEVTALGISHNVEALTNLTDSDRNSFISSKVKELWSTRDFTDYSGGGVRGTTRLVRLLPLGAEFYKP